MPVGNEQTRYYQFTKAAVEQFQGVCCAEDRFIYEGNGWWIFLKIKDCKDPKTGEVIPAGQVIDRRHMPGHPTVNLEECPVVAHIYVLLPKELSAVKLDVFIMIDREGARRQIMEDMGGSHAWYEDEIGTAKDPVNGPKPICRIDKNPKIH